MWTPPSGIMIANSTPVVTASSLFFFFSGFPGGQRRSFREFPLGGEEGRREGLWIVVRATPCKVRNGQHENVLVLCSFCARMALPGKPACRHSSNGGGDEIDLVLANFVSTGKHYLVVNVIRFGIGRFSAFCTHFWYFLACDHGRRWHQLDRFGCYAGTVQRPTPLSNVNTSMASSSFGLYFLPTTPCEQTGKRY